MSLPKTKVTNEKELQLRRLLIKGHLLSDEYDLKRNIPFSNMARPAWMSNKVLGVLGSFILKVVIKKVLRKH